MERIEEARWESNPDGWDGKWTSPTTALEAEEIRIVTLTIHDYIQQHSNPILNNETK